MEENLEENAPKPQPKSRKRQSGGNELAEQQASEMEEALERVAAQLALGDVVRFNRGEYSHVGIYIGRGKVIHLWSPTEHDFQVRIDTLRRVLLSDAQSDAEHYHEYAALTALPECYTDELDERMLADHQLEPLPSQEVVQRAMEKLGERDYDYLSYNCEHFVTWARYGFGASPQVTSHTNHVLAGAMIGAVVGGIAGFVAGGLFSLFLKGDALSASTGTSASATQASGTEVSGIRSSVTQSGFSSEGESDGNSSSGSSSSEDNDSASREARRAQRARLWGNLDNLRVPSGAASVQSDELSQLDEWVEARRRHAAAASARYYSDERHSALATRLAEDELQCG